MPLKRIYPKNKKGIYSTSAKLQSAMNKLTGGRVTAIATARATPNPRYVTPNLSGVEKKFISFNAALGAIQNSVGTPIITVLNACSQGAGVSQHIGQKLLMKQVYYRFGISEDLTSLGTTTTNSNTALVCIVYDKQPNGAVPTWGQMFSVSGNASDPYAVPNPLYSDRFSILAQDLVPICSTGPNNASMTRCIKMRHETKFSGTGNSITDIASGSLLLCAISSYSATACYLNIGLRLSYEDE